MKKIKCIYFLVLFVSSIGIAQAQEFSEPLTGTYSQQIVQVANSSSCASYNWKNRDRAPAGYTKGIALSFARSICRLRANSSIDTAARLMSMADTKKSDTDAISFYRGIFNSRKIAVDIDGENTMRALYTLGLGLGMRESSGAYCEGWDITAGAHRPSSAGEAGLFQTSYDSITTNPDLQMLYTEYQGNPNRCMLDVFQEGVSCRAQSILGTGAGADFQKFNKACPAFATEYAMTLLRVLRSHFGPIIRREAEVKTICNQMLANVQNIVDTNPTAACQELF